MTESNLIQQYLTEVEQYSFVSYYTTRDLGRLYGLVYGDVSGDRKITAYDALLVLRYIVELADLSVEQQKAADVTNDGTISAFDAVLILQYIVGLITEFGQ